MRASGETIEDDLHIKGSFHVPARALEWSAVRASGPGGQHVNKANTAVQLRCDLNSFYIPELFRARILRHRDSRITDAGIVIIKAQAHRSQPRNREDALARLQALLREAIHVDPPRRRTRPTLGSRRRAAKAQVRRKEIKAGRRKPNVGDY